MKRILLALTILVMTAAAKAQTIAELVFSNPVLINGTAGADGAKYKFSSVASGIDAVVEVKGRSDNDVVLGSIDSTGIGWEKALQPIIGIPNVGANRNWWVEFRIQFYVAGTNNKKKISKFFVTGIDIDGDNGNLNEWVEMKNTKNVTLSSITSLTTGSVGSSDNDAEDNSGKGSGDDNYKIVGPVMNFTNIDTAATAAMATYEYDDKDQISFKMGGSTNANGGSSGSAAMRMNSIWFKQFSLNPPLTGLPVTLTAFNAMLINHTTNVDLTWTTATEKNVNRFEVEKSTDGKNYSTAGVVLAYGNSIEKLNYKFTNDIKNDNSAIIYYRLRTVDEDGKFEYSSVRTIRTISQDENTISLLTYPNPVQNEVRVTIPANWQGKKVSYQIANANGQTAQRMETANGSQTETINTSALAPGFYIVIVSCEGQKAQQKIIKK